VLVALAVVVEVLTEARPSLVRSARSAVAEAEKPRMVVMAVLVVVPVATAARLTLAVKPSMGFRVTTAETTSRVAVLLPLAVVVVLAV